MRHTFFTSKKIAERINWWFLAMVLVFAIGIRVWQLSSLPTMLNRDEAALAYNAYLLVEQGKDEWHQPWQMTLKSFGDEKLVGYVLLLAPLIAIWPFQDWAVRFPSAVAGVLLIPCSWFIFTYALKKSNLSAGLAAGFIATTPVFFFYSRVGFEAMAGLVWLLVALLLWLWPTEDTRQRWKLDAIAAVVLAIACATYNTPLLLGIPLLMTVAVTRWLHGQKNLLWSLGLSLMAIVIVGALILPATKQKTGITIFQDPSVYTNFIVWRSTLPEQLIGVIGNKYAYFLLQIGEHTLSLITPTFLVTLGGNHEWHQMPGFSHFTWTLYVLGLFGIFRSIFHIFVVFRKRESDWLVKIWYQLLPLAWLLMATLPSSITVDAPHATRSLFFFLCWVWLAADAVATLGDLHSSKKIGWGLLGLIVIIQLGQFGQYLYTYFMVYPRESSRILESSFKTAIMSAEADFPNTPKAVVDRSGYWYITAAWYARIPAKTFLDTIKHQDPTIVGLRYGEQAGKYHFVANVQDRKFDETIVIENHDDKEQWSMREF